MEFIFMLTHHDVTVRNALELLEEVKDTGLKHVGCKDIGLAEDQLAKLFGKMREYGMTTYLEVVTSDEKEHFNGVHLAVKVGADNLIGGMPQYTEKTIDYLKSKEKRPKFFPYIGRIVGHPCILEGTVDEIIENGEESETRGIDGINLLLYRFKGDHRSLLSATKKLKVPLIVAGNVSNFEQISELKSSGVWAFTIGGAIMENKFVKNAGIKEQVKNVLERI